MGQGQSSTGGLQSTHEDHAAMVDEDGAAFPVASNTATSSAAPNLLTDRVRQCLITDGGAAPDVIDSPMGDKDAEPISAVFTWAYGGENVYITGSFNQWTGKIPMHRSNKDFTVILEIPPGVIEYKFIVDDEWRFAPDQPTTTDAQGVINNQIEIHPAIDYECGFDNDDGDTTASFSQVVPPSDEYAKDPPPLPPHLGIILLNADDISGQSDAVMLPVPQHVTLNHIYASKSDNKEVSVLGMTQRYKSKFVTTVYYRPTPVL